MKKVVWALFDDANGSVSKALADDDKYIVHSFGINELDKPRYLQIDLSKDFKGIMKKLNNYASLFGKPDIIVASPPCNKFSIACAVRGGNVYFEKTDNGVKVGENFEPLKTSVYKNKDPKEIFTEAWLSVSLALNTEMIIKTMKPKHWYIENPRKSYIKHFINSEFENHAEYCMYGFDYQKPTTFYSDTELELRRCNHSSEEHKSKIGSRTSKKEYELHNQKYHLMLTSLQYHHN